MIDDGVVCDEHCRGIGAPRVHAVGDVARWWHPRRGQRVRVEHWTNAVEQAATVAHNIIHPDALRAYAPVDYVWSDQYHWKIQIAGRAVGPADTVLRDPAAGRFAVLHGDPSGPLEGLVAVNWPGAILVGRRALANGSAFADIRSALAQRAVGAAGR